MSQENKSAIEKIFDACADTVAFCPFDNRNRSGGRAGFVLMWSKRGMGFGEITITIDPDAKRDEIVGALPVGKAVIDSECMSKEFVKEMLCKLVDESDFE